MAVEQQQEHRVQAQAALVVLAIYMLAAMVHLEQEHLSAVAVVAQDLHPKVQMLLLITAVTVVRVAAAVEVLVLVVRLAQAATALSISTTKGHRITAIITPA